MFERLKKFLKEVRLELTKVTWPTANELRGSTAVVIVTVLIFTVFIYLVDKGLVLVLHQVLR
jgi:preprotein translocase subunit SecE